VNRMPDHRTTDSIDAHFETPSEGGVALRFTTPWGGGFVLHFANTRNASRWLDARFAELAEIDTDAVFGP
jgi:hypothetical protein